MMAPCGDSVRTRLSIVTGAAECHKLSSLKAGGFGRRNLPRVLCLWKDFESAEPVWFGSCRSLAIGPARFARELLPARRSGGRRGVNPKCGTLSRVSKDQSTARREWTLLSSSRKQRRECARSLRLEPIADKPANEFDVNRVQASLSVKPDSRQGSSADRQWDRFAEEVCARQCGLFDGCCGAVPIPGSIRSSYGRLVLAVKFSYSSKSPDRLDNGIESSRRRETAKGVVHHISRGGPALDGTNSRHTPKNDLNLDGGDKTW